MPHVVVRRSCTIPNCRGATPATSTPRNGHLCLKVITSRAVDSSCFHSFSRQCLRPQFVLPHVGVGHELLVGLAVDLLLIINLGPIFHDKVLLTMSKDH